MKPFVFLLIILFSSLSANARTTNPSCDWLIGKWKCASKESWSGREETMYYNIVRSSESSFRINYHPTQTPEANSYLGFEAYLDGRLNESIKGISRCEESKLIIDYLEDMSDETSAYQNHVFEKQTSGMQLIKAYYSTGDVSFSKCIPL